MKPPGKQQAHNPVSPPVSAILIAGGRSNRMGSDKREMMIGNKSLIAISIRLAEQFSDDIIISANDSLPDFAGYRVVPDKKSDEGPAMGLISALPHIANDQALFLSCDMPFVSQEMISLLMEKYVPDHICCFKTGERIQPFPGIVPRSFMKDIGRTLEKGTRSLTGIIHQLPSVIIKTDQMFRGTYFLNINRPEDLQRAMKINKRGHDL